MTDTTSAPAATQPSFTSAIPFVASILLQIGGISLWPLTDGFTDPLPTLGAVIAGQSLWPRAGR